MTTLEALMWSLIALISNLLLAMMIWLLLVTFSDTSNYIPIVQNYL
jgi:hypothetical protein